MSRTAPEIEPKSAETITFRGLAFLTKSKELRTVEGKAVNLRSQSTEVLCVLAARPGEMEGWTLASPRRATRALGIAIGLQRSLTAISDGQAFEME
jgi:hypothetical protein